MGLSDIDVKEPEPTIPEGECKAICYTVESGIGPGGRESIYVRFRIYEGEYEVVKLFMACPRPKGKLRERHKLLTQWKMANGGKPKKGQRISPKIFKGKLYLITVRDTKSRNPNTNEIRPKIQQYSVVDYIKETLTGIPLL